MCETIPGAPTGEARSVDKYQWRKGVDDLHDVTVSVGHWEGAPRIGLDHCGCGCRIFDHDTVEQLMDIVSSAWDEWMKAGGKVD